MKRSNPKRNVPRYNGDGVDGKRSRTDFAGSSTRRMVRRTAARVRTVEEYEHETARRIDSDIRVPPKPPPVLVLYDLLGDAIDEPGPEAVYGQYPVFLIPKLLPWLQCERREILHVCSGSLRKGEGIRVDIRPAAKPDVIADGRALPFADSSHAAVMLDPPYSADYAASLYGVEYPRPAHLLREAVRVVRPGGRIVLVHYITAKAPPGARFLKAFGLSTGFDMPVRAVSIYERDQRELDLG